MEKTRPATLHRRRLAAEPLEQRHLLSVSPLMVDLNGPDEAGTDFAATFVEDGPAAPVADADVEIADAGLVAGPNGIYVLGAANVTRIDPDTGAIEIVSAQGDLVNPRDVTIEPSGDLLVADGRAYGRGGLIRIDPDTGAQSKVWGAYPSSYPRAVAVDEATGNIFVYSSSRFYKIDPSTGPRRI